MARDSARWRGNEEKAPRFHQLKRTGRVQRGLPRRRAKLAEHGDRRPPEASILKPPKNLAHHLPAEIWHRIFIRFLLPKTLGRLLTGQQTVSHMALTLPLTAEIQGPRRLLLPQADGVEARCHLAGFTALFLASYARTSERQSQRLICGASAAHGLANFAIFVIAQSPGRRKISGLAVLAPRAYRLCFHFSLSPVANASLAILSRYVPLRLHEPLPSSLTRSGTGSRCPSLILDAFISSGWPPNGFS